MCEVKSNMLLYPEVVLNQSVWTKMFVEWEMKSCNTQNWFLEISNIIRFHKDKTEIWTVCKCINLRAYVNKITAISYAHFQSVFYPPQPPPYMWINIQRHSTPSFAHITITSATNNGFIVRLCLYVTISRNELHAQTTYVWVSHNQNLSLTWTKVFL